MSKKIETEITIHATPEKIWKILSNFHEYPDWNPFITEIQGSVEVGNQIQVKIKPQGGKIMIFKPVVLLKKENKELQWLGKLLFKGLFDGEHHFELIDNKNGTTRFIQSERFSGLLVPFFNFDTTTASFHIMNRKLKELAEKN
ncbi:MULTISPECIES: SRPBCC domain-containing protein [Chryseobacterium]|uniref:SRPBCC domain-containing protein n=2 Tax=Chryseobacterium bernardetii TaxID=1241978 RepID=A0A3G6UAL5_9FLAO|nr:MULTISPECIES: SRPBCC domain-containing protein [Chryseobacterium]AZB25531.1 SRPBCC domain-containing protein [Chryseobacterium bernardetii]AZB35926.1 SRPBCC domain-containing protein [Chryseobacterium bernardetii]UCA59757.1 SRPBCC domain-containing protein [Chryseobacterium rhizoplanae]